MKKRVMSLLILSIVLVMTPAAMAEECLRCRPLNHTCIPTTIGGFDLCYWSGVDCIIGEYCGSPTATLPLASEFQVASVERLDEQQQPKPNETRIALLEQKSEPAPSARP